MKNIVLNLLLVLTLCLFTNCNKDDGLESNIIGVWNGEKEIRRSDGSVDFINNTPPYSIGFAYDNGLEIKSNGELIGRCAIRDMDQNPVSWNTCNDIYEGQWSLVKNKLILNDVEYIILSQSENILVIFQQTSPNHIREITLRKQ